MRRNVWVGLAAVALTAALSFSLWGAPPVPARVERAPAGSAPLGTPLFMPLVLRQGTATRTSTPTRTATASLPPPSATRTATSSATLAPADVYIQTIDYNPGGLDLEGEYVRLTNQGGTAANLGGWSLCDLADHCYPFASFNLGPGASVQLWTTTGVDNAANLYWGSGSPIWNNDGDTATLRNAVLVIVDVYTY